jgi:hypothetical protein
MHGVVLWSDRRQNRAVIWCEDHGDLAYYDGDMPEGESSAWLDPGDLVRFDVQEGQRMRLVNNPSVVASDQYPTLAGDVRREGARHRMTLPQAAAAGSKIIPMAPRREADAARPVRKTRLTSA